MARNRIAQRVQRSKSSFSLANSRCLERFQKCYPNSISFAPTSPLHAWRWACGWLADQISAARLSAPNKARGDRVLNVLVNCFFIVESLLDYFKRVLQGDSVISCDDTGVTLLYPKVPPDFDLSDPKQKLGAKVTRHAKYVTFQLAEVAITRKLFAAILDRIERLALPPPAVNGG
jgi:hypothetical protein